MIEAPLREIKLQEVNRGFVEEWWRETSAADFGAVWEKAAIYGSRDLQIMGAALPGGPAHALAFYALGKIARAISSYERKVKPGDDTLDDLVRYAMMLRYWHQKERWP